MYIYINIVILSHVEISYDSLIDLD